MKVLVASDGSEPVMRACEMLARLLAGRSDDVRVLTVLPVTMEPRAQLGGGPRERRERLRAVEDEVEKAVRGPRQILEREGREIETRHRFGNFAEGILAEIAEWRPDLIVMGRRGRGRATRLLMGSVSEHVFREARIPVLLAP